MERMKGPERLGELMEVVETSSFPEQRHPSSALIWPHTVPVLPSELLLPDKLQS